MPSLALGLLAGFAFTIAPPPAAQEGGFKPLFNGKDLTGWVTPENKGLFAVEEGEIVGRSKEKELKKNEFLVTDKPYGDFVLKAKVKYKNGNSGIPVPKRPRPRWHRSGPQARHRQQLLGCALRGKTSEQDPGAVSQRKGRGAGQDGDWNDFEITAKGDHVVITLNGTIVIDRTDPVFQKSGIIALQLHAGPPMEVRFKDVEIKLLDSN